MDEAPLAAIWVYLAASPLLWLTATLVCYLIALWIYRRGGESPLLNPVAIAVVLLIGLLVWTGTPYQTYFDGAQFVHFLLGPATVSLAIPLYRQRARLRELALPIAIALPVAALTGSLSAVGLGRRWARSPRPCFRSPPSRLPLLWPWGSARSWVGCPRSPLCWR